VIKIIGLEHDQVKLVEHCKEWLNIFEDEKAKIKKLFNDNTIQIEHIGSTAVESIPAKPIIDIMVAINDYSLVDYYKRNLSKINYINLGECGRKGRSFLVKDKNNISCFHLHLVEFESIYWENNIFFRDYLQNHFKTAEEYAELKIRLAEKYSDNRNLYRVFKSQFIEKILKLKK
jgi:GrpB-like predicted nucleotidyltransferase (UPF0157 family)